MRGEPLLETAGRLADGELLPDVGTGTDASPDVGILEELAVIGRIAEAHRDLYRILPLTTDDAGGGRTTWAHLDVLELVGEGSFGAVYRAWDTQLHREVALKLFTSTVSPSAVIGEARRLARVSHRNVATVFGADVSHGMPALWMEFVRGSSLDKLVQAQGKLLPAEGAAIVADVARGLTAVHAAGLVHRDIKAQNVMRERDGRVVLMDLGASRASSTASALAASGFAGTPLYMAPELFGGGPATAASDLYSLGVLLFYLVSGTFPITGQSVGDIARGHAASERRSLRDLIPDVSTEYAAVIDRLLALDPANRPASAGEVAEQLAKLAEPPANQPGSSLRGWGRWAVVAGLIIATASAAAFLMSSRGNDSGVSPARHSLAVLPIRNLTGDPAEAFIAEALTESVVASLARVPGLRVASTTATAGLAESSEPLSAIGERLGSDYLLTGSVMTDAARIKLVVKLFDRKSDRPIWGEDFVRERSDLLTAISQLSRLVAARLSAGDPTDSGADRLKNLNPKALDAYLRGVSASSRVPAALQEAVTALRSAVDIEPRFAEAWSALATALLALPDRAGVDDRRRDIDAIRQAAMTAMDLDATQADAYVALGTLQFYYDWDFPAADRSLQRAVELSPSHATARQRRAMLLAALGRVDEAVALALESVAIEPSVPIRSTSLGMIYYYKHDWANATLAMQRALALDPEFGPGHFGLGRILSAEGLHVEAAASIARALVRAPHAPYRIELARVLAQGGRTDEAQRIVDDMNTSGARTYQIDNLAYIAAAEHRLDAAFELLDRAILDRSPNLLWLKVDPRADPLRNDPRFAAVLKRIGLIP